MQVWSRASARALPKTWPDPGEPGHLLSNIGLTELIATTPEQYVATAARWAVDLTSLAALRAGLRERMGASPLTDARRYAADVEAALRRMWIAWCGA
jgi:protein O-GlcNAc transferase